VVGEEALEDGGFAGARGAGDDDGAVFWACWVRTVSAWIFQRGGADGGGGGGTCRSHCDAISECFGTGELQVRARSLQAGTVQGDLQQTHTFKNHGWES